MSCIENINRFIIPNDVIALLTQIYKYIGKNDIYKKISMPDMNRIIEQTIEKDSFYLGKIIKLDITDPRLHLLITKNAVAKNREENILLNIKEMISDIQLKGDNYLIQSNNQLNLINYIYQNQYIKFDDEKKLGIGKVSKRNELDKYNKIMEEQKNQVEPIFVALNYFIDFYNLQPFTNNNKIISYLMLYLLLLRSEVHCFKYISFFEVIYNDLETMEEGILDASFNWNEGIPQIFTFVRYMLNMILQCYKNTDKIVKEYEIDSNINKSDNIENTINSFQGNIFTKDDIRIVHPYVSESTINRALKRLRDEKVIKPLGKGRSAKWMKISSI